MAQDDMRRALSARVRLVPLYASSPLTAARLAWCAEPGAAATLLPTLVGPSPRMLRCLAALIALLQRERVDVLLSAGTQANLAALWARRLAGVGTRVVISECNMMSAVAHMPGGAFARPTRSSPSRRRHDLVSPMTIQKLTDLATPKLFVATAAGTVFDEVTITVTAVGEVIGDVARYVLANAFVSTKPIRRRSKTR